MAGADGFPERGGAWQSQPAAAARRRAGRGLGAQSQGGNHDLHGRCAAAQDLIDLKPNAPKEYRGDLNPIATTCPASKSASYCRTWRALWINGPASVRSWAPNGSHDSFMCYSGRKGSPLTPTASPGGWPSIGATISKLQGTAKAGIPPFIGLAPKAGHPPYGASGKPGFLGAGHGPFKPTT